MNHFKDCECQETAKDRYRSLAKKLHPDMGGSADEMAELTRQYEEFKKYGPSKQSYYENTYKEAFKKYNDAFGGGSTRFRRFSEEEQPRKGAGQTAGWKTNKPRTPHEGYGDIPWDHPIRQELFNLRNRLADLDNTYKRPKEDRDEELETALSQVKYWKNKHDAIWQQYDQFVRESDYWGRKPHDVIQELKQELAEVKSKLAEQKKKATKLRQQIKMLKSNLKT